jgi:hypothetical protein
MSIPPVLFNFFRGRLKLAEALGYALSLNQWSFHNFEKEKRSRQSFTCKTRGELSVR